MEPQLQQQEQASSRRQLDFAEPRMGVFDFTSQVGMQPRSPILSHIYILLYHMYIWILHIITALGTVMADVRAKVCMHACSTIVLGLGQSPLDVAFCAGNQWPHSSHLSDAVGPPQDALDVEAAKSAVLPPFQSIMELTSAAAPPQRGAQPGTAISAASTAGRPHESRRKVKKGKRACL